MKSEGFSKSSSPQTLPAPMEARKKTLIIMWELHICKVPHLTSIICYYVYAIIYGMQGKLCLNILVTIYIPV